MTSGVLSGEGSAEASALKMARTQRGVALVKSILELVLELMSSLEEISAPFYTVQLSTKRR